MAIQKIEYQNKESIVDDPSVAEKNKVTADNMNELKAVINNNADEFTNVIGDLETILQTLDTGSGV